MDKKQLVAYAKKYELEWREDATNESDVYLRNIVRRRVLKNIDQQQRTILEQIIVRQSSLNRQIDMELSRLAQRIAKAQTNNVLLSRYELIMLPGGVLYELLQHILLQHTGTTREKQIVWRAMLFCKTAKNNKIFQLDNNWQLRTMPGTVIVEPRLL
jgi:tRNA(Ile)-lysidine synthase TilS/MesJ